MKFKEWNKKIDNYELNDMKSVFDWGGHWFFWRQKLKKKVKLLKKKKTLKGRMDVKYPIRSD